MTEPITRSALITHFSQSGIHKGDNLIIHSSMKAMGPVEGGAETVIDALLETVGPGGNLMFPTFNYTRPIPEPYYDPDTTRCRTGIINETARKRPDAVRSLHPTHSVAVIGPDSSNLTANHLDVRAVGVNSPIDLLAKHGGKILLLGVGQTSNTAIHIAEEYAGIPKCSWYDPPPQIRILTPSGNIISHTLDDSPSCSAAFDVAEYVLNHSNIISYFRISSCQCRLMKAQEVIEAVACLLKKQPNMMLCNWEKCIPCQGSRRKLAEAN